MLTPPNPSESRPSVIYDISLPLDDTSTQDITFNVAIGGRPTLGTSTQTASGLGPSAPLEALTLSIRRRYATTDAPEVCAAAPQSASLPLQGEHPRPSESTPPLDIHPENEHQGFNQSPSSPVSPTLSELALRLSPSLITSLFMRLPEPRAYFGLDETPSRPPSPASSESVLPASSPSIHPVSPAQQGQHLRSPSPLTANVPEEAGSKELLIVASPPRLAPPSPTNQPKGSPPTTPHQRLAPQSLAPAPEQAAQSGSDTEEEHDHLFNAYMLGCADGRGEGRNDALKLVGVEGRDVARIVAARVLEVDLDMVEAMHASRSPRTHVPFPNMRRGCPLTPRTRKRLEDEVPPSPILRERVKRYKDENGIGKLVLQPE